MPALKYPDALLPTLLAGGWTALAYTGGIWLCLQPSLAANLIGTLALAHGIVIAAYLVHECAHNAVFTSSAWNARLGTVLNWLTGAVYSPFEQIRHKHMRHHVDRADVVAVNYRQALRRAPKPLLWLLEGLERIGVPVLEVGLRALAVVLPFRRARYAHLRGRVLIVGALRLVFFAALAAVSPWILLWYALAYLLSLQILRYMDAHQHTFDLRADLYDPEVRPGPLPGLDRDFEDRNTFSNLLSERWPALNLLVLNFCYHNAHHLRPAQPWYRLPRIHREHYPPESPQILQPADTRRAFLRYRGQRMLNEDAPDSGVRRGNSATFVGVDGVSFLAPY